MQVCCCCLAVAAGDNFDYLQDVTIKLLRILVCAKLFSHFSHLQDHQVAGGMWYGLVCLLYWMQAASRNTQPFG
jgi:hypothetical protein